MIVPGKNRICTNALADEAVDDPDDILIIETPEITTVSTGEDFNVDHVIYGLVVTLYFSID